LLPNPCTFSVGGIVIGTISEDVLRDMSAQSTFQNARGHRPERIPQLAKQLLDQRSFYPVYPPSEQLPLDMAQQAHVALPLCPDILMTPSRLAPFIKVRQHQYKNPFNCYCPSTLSIMGFAELKAGILSLSLQDLGSALVCLWHAGYQWHHGNFPWLALQIPVCWVLSQNGSSPPKRPVGGGCHFIQQRRRCSSIRWKEEASLS